MEAILRKIHSGKLKVEPVLVFSDNATANGLDIARKYKIPVETATPKDFSDFAEYEKKAVSYLRAYRAQWIVCAGYMRILRETILAAYPGKILNIHPSLLPSFPGLKAQKQALDYGVKISGCTVHYVDSGMDTGPIIGQTAVDVQETDDVDSLSQRILKAEHDLYWRAIDKVVVKKK